MHLIDIKSLMTCLCTSLLEDLCAPYRHLHLWLHSSHGLLLHGQWNQQLACCHSLIRWWVLVVSLMPMETPWCSCMKSIWCIPSLRSMTIGSFHQGWVCFQKIINDADNQAQANQEAFEYFKNNHPLSLLSHKGYIQWQGSDAQELLLHDMEQKLHETLWKKELCGTQRENFEQFPLSVFWDKIYQEQPMAKHLYTCLVMGLASSCSKIK